MEKTVESRRNTCHSEAAPVGIVPRCIGVQKRRLGGPAGPRRQCQPSRAGKQTTDPGYPRVQQERAGCQG